MGAEAVPNTPVDRYFTKINRTQAYKLEVNALDSQGKPIYIVYDNNIWNAVEARKLADLFEIWWVKSAPERIEEFKT